MHVAHGPQNLTSIQSTVVLYTFSAKVLIFHFFILQGGIRFHLSFLPVFPSDAPCMLYFFPLCRCMCLPDVYYSPTEI